jgi:hypothetical protein
MRQLSQQQLRLNMTTNIGVGVPPDATQNDLDKAFALAHLSKDAGIGNLSWAYMKEALGDQVNAYVEDSVRTEELSPDRSQQPLWPAIVFPVLAGAPPPRCSTWEQTAFLLQQLSWFTGVEALGREKTQHFQTNRLNPGDRQV